MKSREALVGRQTGKAAAGPSPCHPVTLSPGHPVTRSPCHLLVVDDEPLIRDTLAEFLGQEGFTVAACASGEEALALAAEQRFDVALCDVQLPGMDGVELLQ